VLSLPPAFVLSQNQTLKFYEFVPTYARFDEDTLFFNAEAFSEVSQRSKERRYGVSQKTCPPKSRLQIPQGSSRSQDLEEICRKASAVHVSLSSYSIVKEQINRRETLYRPIA
tara:strand:+ start:145 stop:483 length:339 start_codon:yes stop_codon:yes gene_type:complete